MKRFIETLICLMIVSTVIYMKPVVASHQASKTQNNVTTNVATPVPQAVPYHELNATALAKFIGVTEKEWLKTFPNPTKELINSETSKTFVYGDNLDDFFQASVSDGAISSVFVLGKQQNVEPFQLNMELTDLAEVTTIFSNFKFSYGEERFEAELTEEDMNYRPLVAFNNDSFAMLHVSQKTGRLIGIRYLDKKTLLELMPYQMVTPNPYKQAFFENQDSEELEQLNKNNREQFIQILNLLRQEENKSVLEMDGQLQQGTKEAFDILNKKPEEVFNTEERVLEWEEFTTDPYLNPFTLNVEELNQLQRLSDLKYKEVHGMFYAPIQDAPLLVTEWYGNRLYHDQLMHKKDKGLGVTFQGNHVLVYLNHEGTKTTTNESSDKDDL